MKDDASSCSTCDLEWEEKVQISPLCVLVLREISVLSDSIQHGVNSEEYGLHSRDKKVMDFV